MKAKNAFTQEADFRRERDFGTKVSTTFEFVSAQFRPLFKCLAYFVLPGALLSGIGMGLFMDKFMALMPQNGRGANQPNPTELAQSYSNAFTGTSFVGLGLTVAGLMVVFLLLSSTVYGFVRVRLSTPPAEEVQPRQVWAFVWPRLGRIVGAWLVLGLGLVLGMGLLGGALSLLGPAFVMLIFFPLIWVVICFLLYFPVLWMEDTGVLESLGRSFYLIKGKWWSSLGVYMAMSFISGIVNYVFLIPMYGLMALRTLKIPGFESEILSVAATSFYALGIIFTAVLPLMAMLFQYFNLVERKEGVGLRLLVDTLGRTAAPQMRNATLQPDDEGEY